jgi:Kef-type K+ transport system membrane component KefB
MSEGLYQAFIYLLAAIVAVPVAKRLGFGSVIGYLLDAGAAGVCVVSAIGAAPDPERATRELVAELEPVVERLTMGLLADGP